MNLLVFQLAASAALGGGLAVVHLATLRTNIRAYLGGRWPLALAAQFLRVAATGLAFWLVVRGLGALGLVAALAGFTVGRTVLVRRAVASR